MGDGTVAEQRGVRDVERPADDIDVRQGGTCGRREAHAPDGRSLLSPGRERKSDGGV
jgi:hypothetical protein